MEGGMKGGDGRIWGWKEGMEGYGDGRRGWKDMGMEGGDGKGNEGGNKTSTPPL